MAVAMITALKRVFVGSPMATAQAKHERLAKIPALAIFCSDAISSVAHGPEEIRIFLALAGTAALSLTVPIALAVIPNAGSGTAIRHTKAAIDAALAPGPRHGAL